jgi:short-subunit dehydrogenase
VVYAACKSYLNTFSQVLHNELEGTGVQVQALCPGFVRGTEFHDDVPGFDRSRHAGARLDAQSVVQASLAGLRLGEVICVPGLDDPALVERVGAAERELLGSAGRAGLAQRYADTPSL